MPSLSETSYSHDATIAAIRSYYTFLTKLYLPTSSIVEPPPEGWPSITTETLSALEKTETVVELLRHLPYIREPDDDAELTQGAPYCYFADYSSDRFGPDLREGRGEKVKIITEGAADGEVPAHVVGLTKGGRDAPMFLLDTKLGIVHWPGCPDEIGKQEERQHPREPITDDPFDYAPENEAEWRSDAPAWPVVDFFEVLKDEFRALRFVPINWQSVFDIYTDFDDDEQGLMPMLQGVYGEHGWPDETVYRKEECLAAVKKALEEHYPDYVDYV